MEKRKGGPKQLPRSERFWQRVDRSGDCWEWRGNINQLRGGYGYFYDDDQRLRRAHRIAWELQYGQVLTESQALMHLCDNPSCVRPEHLKIGDQQENMRDMRRKNRQVKTFIGGTRRYNAKLTEAIVKEARRRYAAGESQTALAKEYGVTQACMQAAITRRGWKHVA